MNAFGTWTKVKVKEILPDGAELDGGDLGRIFLPAREIPAETTPGATLDVFLYRDADSGLIASTTRPAAELGQCAFMKIVGETKGGVFAHWGLAKDLFVPMAEQYKALEQGRSYVILVYLDERTGRLAGSTRLHSRLSENGMGFQQGQEVELLICGFSDLGYKAVINHTHLGLIFRDDAPGELRYGERRNGYIKAIRPDGKIDLSLTAPGLSGLDALGTKILEHLRVNGGISTLTDKSPAQDIADVFGVSKSQFKKALGRLYKHKAIRIEAERIILL